MPTSIAHTSKETMENLIRDAFHNVDHSMDYIYNKASELIQTAEHYGLTDLAEELKLSE